MLNAKTSYVLNVEFSRFGEHFSAPKFLSSELKGTFRESEGVVGASN